MMRFCSLTVVILLAAPLLLVTGQEAIPPTTPLLPANGDGQASQTCGANQHFDPCGSSCPANCSNFRDPIICTEDCRPGCYCNEGYVFHMVIPNLCVEENQCPIGREGEYSCDKPQRVLNMCGTACPKTCANRNDSIPCIKPCVIGCFCVEGYLSNSNGDCVLEAECD